MMIDYHKLKLLGEAFKNYVSKDGQEGMIKSDFIDMYTVINRRNKR